MSEDRAYFPDDPHARAGGARPSIHPVVAEAVARYFEEHGGPSVIHGVAIEKMLQRVRQTDPYIREIDFRNCLQTYGYVLDQISLETGDYKYIG